jgi:hypothetical protein
MKPFKSGLERQKRTPVGSLGKKAFHVPAGLLARKAGTRTSGCAHVAVTTGFQRALRSLRAKDNNATAPASLGQSCHIMVAVPCFRAERIGDQ